MKSFACAGIKARPSVPQVTSPPFVVHQACLWSCFRSGKWNDLHTSSSEWCSTHML